MAARPEVNRSPEVQVDNSRCVQPELIFCTESGQDTISLDKPKASSSIKPNEEVSYFMICTGWIAPKVLLVGICINKLREWGSSEGIKLCMYYKACEWLVRTVSALRSRMCSFDWPVILHFVLGISWLSSGVCKVKYKHARNIGSWNVFNWPKYIAFHFCVLPAWLEINFLAH